MKYEEKKTHISCKGNEVCSWTINCKIIVELLLKFCFSILKNTRNKTLFYNNCCTCCFSSFCIICYWQGKLIGIVHLYVHLFCQNRKGENKKINEKNYTYIHAYIIKREKCLFLYIIKWPMTSIKWLVHPKKENSVINYLPQCLFFHQRPSFPFGTQI